MEFENVDSNLTNLIVNYLPQDFRNGELYSMFVTIGPIESHRVMINKQTGYSYGYGFVNYKNPEDAAKAIEKLNGLPVDNKKIKVAYARPCNREELVENNLYIRRLPRDITEDKLQELFGRFGTITSKKLLKDCLTGLNRGVGFVRFSKKSEAQAAIEALDDQIPPGGIERLSVRVASDQKKQNMAFYAGFLESQKYITGDLDSSPMIAANKLLQQQNFERARLRVASPCYLLPNQNGAYRPRGPSFSGLHRPIFPLPNQINGNFPRRGDRTGFVRYPYHTTAAPSSSIHPTTLTRQQHTTWPSLSL